MCTIGSSFYNYNRNPVVSFFKQCDLVTPTKFVMPKLQKSPAGIRYLAMTREKDDGTSPAWAGVNEYGVSFVAADSYVQDEKVITSGKFAGKTVFDMYLETITNYKNAKEAAEMACDFYETDFHEPDIFMVGDASTSYFIEAYNGNVACIELDKEFFASTNHFRMIYGAAPYRANHSTYLRLNRAEQILQNKPDLDGIGDVLRDKYYGETVWSICRNANAFLMPEEELYYTQAAAIFTVKPIENPTNPIEKSTKPEITCEFVLNNNASVVGVGYKWNVFAVDKPVPVKYIGKLSNLDIVTPTR